MNWENTATENLCNIAISVETSLHGMEKILWTSHFLAPKHVFSSLTPKTTAYGWQNLHEIMEVPLRDWKVGVWCTVSWSHIIDSIFFKDPVNSECYCELFLYPFIGHLNEDSIDHGCFQQYYVTAHMIHVSMVLLCSVFCECLI